MIDKVHKHNSIHGIKRIDRAPITNTNLEKSFPLRMKRYWRYIFKMSGNPCELVYNFATQRAIQFRYVILRNAREFLTPSHTDVHLLINSISFGLPIAGPMRF